MQLDEALGQISEIRAHLAQAEAFRGVRSLTVAGSGLLAIGAAVLQADQIARPADQIWRYVDLWSTVAVLSLVVVGCQLAYRCFTAGSPQPRRLTLLATRQFAPCLVAGAIVTLVIPVRVPDAAWMLPGLWAILFSLGIFSCHRLLPRATSLVALHYMASGALCLTLGDGPHALSPWMMVGTFGVGQLMAAAVLYFGLERAEESSYGS